MGWITLIGVGWASSTAVLFQGMDICLDVYMHVPAREGMLYHYTLGNYASRLNLQSWAGVLVTPSILLATENRWYDSLHLTNVVMLSCKPPLMLIHVCILNGMPVDRSSNLNVEQQSWQCHQFCWQKKMDGIWVSTWQMLWWLSCEPPLMLTHVSNLLISFCCIWSWSVSTVDNDWVHRPCMDKLYWLCMDQGTTWEMCCVVRYFRFLTGTQTSH
jgi:hypothetical protein